MKFAQSVPSSSSSAHQASQDISVTSYAMPDNTQYAQIQFPQPSEHQPTRVVVLTDTTGSTGIITAQRDGSSRGITVLDGFKIITKACATFLQAEKDRMNIKSTAFYHFNNPSYPLFGGRDVTLGALSDKAITNEIYQLKPMENTNIYGAVCNAMECLDRMPRSGQSSSSSVATKDVLFLITDGRENVHDHEDWVAKIRTLNQSRATPVVFAIIGFGINVDSEKLNRLALDSGGLYVYVNDLSTARSSVANVLARLTHGFMVPGITLKRFDGSVERLSPRFCGPNGTLTIPTFDERCADVRPAQSIGINGREFVLSAAVDCQLPETPDYLQCPISHDIMQDPVMTADGHTYERQQIERWFVAHSTSPLTGLSLPHRHLIPNVNVRKMIADYNTRRLITPVASASSVMESKASTAASGGGVSADARQNTLLLQSKLAHLILNMIDRMRAPQARYSALFKKEFDHFIRVNRGLLNGIDPSEHPLTQMLLPAGQVFLAFDLGLDVTPTFLRNGDKVLVNWHGTNNNNNSFSQIYEGTIKAMSGEASNSGSFPSILYSDGEHSSNQRLEDIVHDTFFNRWGMSYLFSLVGGLLDVRCLDNKTNIATSGSESERLTVARTEELFLSILDPCTEEERARRVRASAMTFRGASSSSYNHSRSSCASSGLMSTCSNDDCIGGLSWTTSRLPSGVKMSVQVHTLKTGDTVMTADGWTTINAIVEGPRQARTLYQVGSQEQGAYLTAWHPYWNRYNSSVSYRCEFPAQSSHAKSVQVHDSIRSFYLDNHSDLALLTSKGTVYAATLGPRSNQARLGTHPTLKHRFFNSQAVIDTLNTAKRKQASEGVLVIKSRVRDEETGQVKAWVL